MTLHLGFEIGTGRPVEIPLGHTVVTGMTQNAGKTTALEALITRSKLRAVTFVTKRGESAFAGGRRIPPFFRERADWVFISSLIDATMGGKNRMLHSFLMKVCRNTRTLAEVRQNVKAAQASARRGFDESIYTQIDGYLDLVVPQLAQLPPVREVKIGAGLNVMDLSPYSSELQALVIRSVIEHVYEHEKDVVTVIPEAWEFLPEGRGSPVKADAETLIRKGAGLRNFVWLDSQDLAGVWKLAVRAAPVVLVGVQREANEIKRTLANIPGSIAKPKAADVATLELGQFYACWGRHAVKVYVQPAWMNPAQAQQVATGALTLDVAARLSPGSPHWGPRKSQKEETVNAAEAEQLRTENAKLREENEDLRRRLDAIEKGTLHDGQRVGARSSNPAGEPRAQRAPDHARAIGGDRAAAAVGPMDRDVRAATSVGGRTSHPDFSEETNNLYHAFKARLIAEAATDPVLLRALTTRPEIEVRVQRRVIETSGDTLRGRLALMIAEGWFDSAKAGNAAHQELQRRGQGSAKPNVYRELDKLATDGFVTKEDGGYQAVPGMKINIVEAA